MYIISTQALKKGLSSQPNNGENILTKGTLKL